MQSFEKFFEMYKIQFYVDKQLQHSQKFIKNRPHLMKTTSMLGKFRKGDWLRNKSRFQVFGLKIHLVLALTKVWNLWKIIKLRNEFSKDANNVSLSFNRFTFWLKDTHREKKAPSIETPVLVKGMDITIWVLGTPNQLFLRGS